MNESTLLATVALFVAQAGFTEAAAQLMAFFQRDLGQDEELLDLTIGARYGPAGRTRIMRQCMAGDVPSLYHSLYDRSGNLRKGANVALRHTDAKGLCALHHAAIEGHAASVRLLVKAGSSPLRENGRWLHRTWPLGYAAACSSPAGQECFETLLEATMTAPRISREDISYTYAVILLNALRTVCDKGLHMTDMQACAVLEARALKITEALVALGPVAFGPLIDNSDEDDEPTFALAVAAQGPWVSVIRRLLAAGANPFALDTDELRAGEGGDDRYWARDGVTGDFKRHLESNRRKFPALVAAGRSVATFSELTSAMTMTALAGAAVWLDGSPVTFA